MDTAQHISRLFPPAERDTLTLRKLQGDASSRQYFRANIAAKSCIACFDPVFAASPDNYPFLEVHRLLETHGIPVPRLIDLDSRHGILLLEDCGTLSLQDAAGTASGKELATLYEAVLELMLDIQAIPQQKGCLPFTLSFDEEKLLFEFDFFIEHALGGRFRQWFDQKAREEIRRALAPLAALLAGQKGFVLNHRDFHSRNILISQSGPVVIDFQDARMGLAQYDAASLLRDSYVRIDDHTLKNLRERHYEGLRLRGLASTGRDEYLRLFDLMAFQRNIKAIGTFCYQADVLRKPGYEESIGPTLAYLPGYIASSPELREAGNLLEPLLQEMAP